MNRPTPLVLTCLLALAALTACDPYVAGNGVLATKACQSQSGFTRLHLGLGIDATVAVNAVATPSCTFSGDENLVEHVKVSASGDALETTTDLHSFDRILPLKLTVTMPAALEAEVTDYVGNGGARFKTRIAISGAATPAFTARGSGLAEVVLSGAGGNTIDVGLDGGAYLFAFGYPVATATVDLDGGSRAELFAAGVVTGNAVGGSSVVVHGGGTCGVVVQGGSTCTVP
jgi:hypothetical protein